MREYLAWLSPLAAWLSPLGQWVTAATSGAIAAWLLTYVRERFNRPKLVIEINHDLGSVVESDTRGGVQAQKHARVIVRNTGRAMAKNCCASIDYLKRKGGPTGTEYIFKEDMIDLGWSHSPGGTKNIPSRGFWRLDIARNEISRVNLETKNHSANKFAVGVASPTRLLHHLMMDAEYELHLRAYADNAAPADFSCRVKVGKTFHDLTIEQCHDPRPTDAR